MAVRACTSAESLQNFKIQIQQKYLARSAIFIVVVFVLLCVSFTFNIHHALSDPCTESSALPINHDSYPFHLSYPVEKPEAGTISCPKCPHWGTELLRLTKIVRLKHVAELFPQNQEPSCLMVEGSGTFQMYPDIGVIKLAYKVHLSSSQPPLHSFRYEAFENWTGSDLRVYRIPDGEKWQLLEEDFRKFFSTLFSTLRGILSLESVMAVGGTKLGHSEWGEIILNLGRMETAEAVENNFNELERHRTKLCGCLKVLGPIKETGKPQYFKLIRGCDSEQNTSLMFQPIFDLEEPCPAMGTGEFILN